MFECIISAYAYRNGDQKAVGTAHGQATVSGHMEVKRSFGAWIRHLFFW
jgi:hypothetical protein